MSVEVYSRNSSSISPESAMAATAAQALVLTTTTAALALSSVSILRCATSPAPTTKHRECDKSTNIGK